MVHQRVREWFKPQTKPKDPVLGTNEEFFLTLDQDQRIEKYEFVVLDTELTGLNPRRDEILSIGAVRVRGMRIVIGEYFHTYVQARKASSKESTLIHRITSEQLQTAPRLEQALPEFVAFCDTALLVGHYVQLDLAFINKASKKILGGVMSNLSVDCARLARAYKAKLYRTGVQPVGLEDTYQLGKLAKEYALPLFSQHDALEDAMQTAYLFIFLVAKLREQGLLTLHDFRRAAEVGLGEERVF